MLLVLASESREEELLVRRLRKELVLEDNQIGEFAMVFDKATGGVM